MTGKTGQPESLPERNFRGFARGGRFLARGVPGEVALSADRVREIGMVSKAVPWSSTPALYGVQKGSERSYARTGTHEPRG